MASDATTTTTTSSSSTSTLPKPPPIFQLACPVQTYPTGKQGTSSPVVTLQLGTPEVNFTYSSTERYAELWLGSTHKNGPAKALFPSSSSSHDASGSSSSKKKKNTSTTVDIRDLISSHREYLLGKELIRAFPDSNEVPFLFKILSAGRALAIQAHPDKALGEKLHALYPDSYVDTNHKPEIALAISKFEAFAGFKIVDELVAAVDGVPELRRLCFWDQEIVPRDLGSYLREGQGVAAFKQMLNSVLAAGKQVVEEAAEGLLRRCETEEQEKVFPFVAGEKARELVSLFQRTNEMYPKDVGCFVAVFFMNYLCVEPGECLWVPADGIHAWLQGDIIECMAVSDNVTNVGFVPREERDRKIFVEMVTFKPSKAEEQILEGQKWGKFSMRYDPPIHEFSILKSVVPKGETEEIGGFVGPGVTIVVEGKGMLRWKLGGEEGSVVLSKGKIYFIVPGTETAIESDEELEVYRSTWEGID
ncbi:Mannose-6-phosphate isomerase [Agyrium rufum]|nr:Mannose-6-phosphate isomerase [Agyrium rufum]